MSLERHPITWNLALGHSCDMLVAAKFTLTLTFTPKVVIGHELNYNGLALNAYSYSKAHIKSSATCQVQITAQAAT